MDGHVHVPSHVEDVTEVVLFANESVAEDVEVATGELDEVDDDGASLLAGADGEVSGHVGGEGANASASACECECGYECECIGCGFQRRWVRL